MLETAAALVGGGCATESPRNPYLWHRPPVSRSTASASALAARRYRSSAPPAYRSTLGAAPRRPAPAAPAACLFPRSPLSRASSHSALAEPEPPATPVMRPTHMSTCSWHSGIAASTPARRGFWSPTPCSGAPTTATTTEQTAAPSPRSASKSPGHLPGSTVLGYTTATRPAKSSLLTFSSRVERPLLLRLDTAPFLKADEAGDGVDSPQPLPVAQYHEDIVEPVPDVVELVLRPAGDNRHVAAPGVRAASAHAAHGISDPIFNAVTCRRPPPRPRQLRTEKTGPTPTAGASTPAPTPTVSTKPPPSLRRPHNPSEINPDHAARLIQTFWRRRLAAEERNIQSLAQVLLLVRSFAALTIQRHCRGFLIRRLMRSKGVQNLPRPGPHEILYWNETLDKASKEQGRANRLFAARQTTVKVVGDFSNPPWSEEGVEMRLCRTRQVFAVAVDYVAGGIYNCQFIVDGQRNVTCPWFYPTVKNDAGQGISRVKISNSPTFQQDI